MPPARLAALCAAVLLAGCLTATEPEAPAPGARAAEAAAAPLDLAWGLEGCHAAVVFLDAPGERVRPHLPEGFEPAPVPQGFAGGGPNPTGGGSFGIEMFTCESGLGLDGAVHGMAYGSYFAFVEPPAGLRRDDAGLHFVKWDVLVPDAPRRDLLGARGAPAVDGSVEFGAWSLQGSLGAAEGTLVLGDATHRISGATAAPGPTTVTFVEYMAVEDGLLAWWTAAKTSGGIGGGEVTVAEGSLAAEVLGAGTHRGGLLLFEGSFTEGSIESVPDA